MQFITKLKLRWGDLERRLIRIPYHWRGVGDRFLPRRLADATAQYDEEYVVAQVNYYNKMDTTFSVQNQTPIWQSQFVRFGKLGHSYYTLDLLHILTRLKNANRGSKVRLDYLFGDVTAIPPYPTIVKSRPIDGDNRHSVLLKLDSMRHFRFVRDPLSFEQKQDRAVWRGSTKVNPQRRAQFVEQYRDHPRCNVAGHVKQGCVKYLFSETYMEISEQLQYKFIISIEGNDVATNLKWIMSSNSLCLAPQPKYETWFMEGNLIKDFHYVQIADDFSDLLEKMDYYLAHPDEAKAIIANANQYVAQFRDQPREDYIGRRVLMKYFEQSGQ